MEMFKRSYSHFSVNLVLRLGLRLAPSEPHYEGEHPEGRKGPAGGYHPHDRSKSWPCGLSASQRPSSTSCSLSTVQSVESWDWTDLTDSTFTPWTELAVSASSVQLCCL